MTPPKVFAYGWTMVDRIRKGLRSLQKAKKLAESLGFKVGKVEFRTKYRKEKDLFGLFDQIWISEIIKPLFVQVKTNKKPPKKVIDEYETFSKKYHVYVLIVVFFDRKEPQILFITPAFKEWFNKEEFASVIDRVKEEVWKKYC